MSFDHPFLFHPIMQPRIWGGRKLRDSFGKNLPDDEQLYGESWEVCDRAEANSTIATGPHAGTTLQELWTNHREAVFGPKSLACPSPRFPVLIKILDAREHLSLQVHPPAQVAAELGGESKTEWWYVAEAEPHAKIYAGLKRGTSRSDFENFLHRGKLEDCVHELRPRTGDHLFLPSGRFHAIGGGLIIFEVQQNSDTTYRVFDWNRVDAEGRARDLHVEESLRCIDFEDFEPPLEVTGPQSELVACDWFRVNHADLSAGQPWRPPEKAGVILTVISGTLGGCKRGDCLVVPANVTEENLPVAGAEGAGFLEIHPGYRSLHETP